MVRETKLNTEHQWLAAAPRWHNGQTLSQNAIDEAVDKNSSFDKRKLILIILTSRCASVVRWAVLQTAKVQQCMCHYCHTRAKQLGDLWTAAPTTFELRLTWIFAKICCRGGVSGTCKSQSSRMHVPLLSWQSKTARAGRLANRWANDSRDSTWIFWQIMLSWWGERYAKKAKLNNARTIIVLAQQKDEWLVINSQVSGARNSQTATVQQCTCLYCPSRTKQLGDLWIAAPATLELHCDVIFLPNFAAVVRWAVREKATVQQCACHYCASPAKKMGDLLSIRKLAVRETAKQPQFNSARAIIVLAEQKQL